MKHKFSCWLLCLFSTAVLRAAAPDIVLADFEDAGYGEWKATGDAFGAGPARGALPGQMAVSGFAGKGLVNSFYGGDKSTGTLTSPEFPINRRHVSFLIGGGGHDGKTCMNLLVGGEIVRTITGPNKQSGGTERLEPEAWDVGDFAGKTARIEIVDQATGGWGHINVDQIVLTDRKPSLTLNDATRELALDRRYLNFPVKNGAKKRRMSLSVDGVKAREFEIELADAAPDWWAFLDVSAFAGKKGVLRVDKLPEDSAGLKSIEAGDTIKDSGDLYREKHRPQFHFSTRRGWINDPNGLVFYQGEYHLYYQHNPYGWDWGNMHWAHAVSTDLVQWRELPVAIYPKQFGDWAFSGSAVVDWKNTSGFKNGENDVLVAAYTSTGRGECIVYSNDRGRTWTEYDGNPVVKHQGRDPRLFWHEPTRRWVMAVYTEPKEDGKTRQTIAFHSSPDLKQWEYHSREDGYYECPDMFELPVDGDASNRKWVLTAANDDYAIGAFDGRKFTKESGKHRGNHGNCFYAAQTYSDIPAADGRRIQIGWARVSHPAMPFNQMMAFPCELTLRTTPDGVRLCALPAKEIEKLHGKRHSVPGQPLPPGENPLAAVTGDLFHIRAEFALGDAIEVGFNLRGVPVSYDVKKQELICKDKTAPLKLLDGRLRLQVLVDRTSIEIYASDGLVYMPMGVIPKDEDKSLGVFAKGSAATIRSLEVFELRSAWFPAEVAGK